VIDRVRSKAAAEGAPENVVADLYRSLIEAAIRRELEKFEADSI
jgi:hypothetical protein